MEHFKRFNLIMLTVISTMLTGCFAVRHSGYSTDMQTGNGWQEKERTIGKYTSTRLMGECDGHDVKPSANDIRFLTWIGPPFLPIFPVTRPHQYVMRFRIFYQYFKEESIDNCPAISINKGVFIKSYEFAPKDTCYYFLQIPPTDFTMSFEGGLDGCKLDDLNFKVEPFSTVDWFWTFKG